MHVCVPKQNPAPGSIFQISIFGVETNLKPNIDMQKRDIQQGFQPLVGPTIIVQDIEKQPNR